MIKFYMRKQFETMDDYIKTFPTDVQNILEKMNTTNTMEKKPTAAKKKVKKNLFV